MNVNQLFDSFIARYGRKLVLLEAVNRMCELNSILCKKIQEAQVSDAELINSLANLEIVRDQMIHLFSMETQKLMSRLYERKQNNLTQMQQFFNEVE